MTGSHQSDDRRHPRCDIPRGSRHGNFLVHGRPSAGPAAPATAEPAASPRPFHRARFTPPGFAPPGFAPPGLTAPVSPCSGSPCLRTFWVVLVVGERLLPPLGLILGETGGGLGRRVPRAPVLARLWHPYGTGSGRGFAPIFVSPLVLRHNGCLPGGRGGKRRPSAPARAGRRVAVPAPATPDVAWGLNPSRGRTACRPGRRRPASSPRWKTARWRRA